MAAQTILDATWGWGVEPSADSAQATRVLVADDQPGVRYALCLLLKSAGYETCTANGPAEVLEAVKAKQADVVVMDLNYTRDTTSGGEGLDLIGAIRKLDADLPLLAMTAWGSIDLAVEAMRQGAADFVQKPWTTTQLLQKVKTLADLRQRAHQSRLEEQEERGDAVAIQRKLLAFEAPGAPEGEISGMSQSLRFVGGDYCRVDEVGARRFAVSIADVAGKGVPGALLAASLRAAERPLIAEGLEPRQLCATLNQAMGEITPQGKFISFFFGLLDLERKSLVYSNAGHNPPLLIRSDGTVGMLRTGGAVLGYFAEWDYEQADVELASGDRMVLFTDGIVEAWHEAHGEFGVERLAQLASARRGLAAADMQRQLTQAVSEHCGGRFHDDATLVVIAVP